MKREEWNFRLKEDVNFQFQFYIYACSPCKCCKDKSNHVDFLSTLTVHRKRMT
jgi:hypothetical protein